MLGIHVILELVYAGKVVMVSLPPHWPRRSRSAPVRHAAAHLELCFSGLREENETGFGHAAF